MSDGGRRARALWTKGERAEGTGPRQLGRAEGNKKKQAGLGCAGLGLGEKLGRAREERERGGAGRKGFRAGPLGWFGFSYFPFSFLFQTNSNLIEFK